MVLHFFKYNNSIGYNGSYGIAYVKCNNSYGYVFDNAFKNKNVSSGYDFIYGLARKCFYAKMYNTCKLLLILT